MTDHEGSDGDSDESTATSSEDSTVATSRGRAKPAEAGAGAGPGPDFIAKVEPAADEPAAEDQDKPARIAREGHVFVRYAGTADRIEAGPEGEIVFRAGEAALEVPTAVAEELLTMPGETFVTEE